MDRSHSPVNKSRGIHPYVLAGILPVCFFAVFYFYPVSGILANSFFKDGRLETAFIDQFFGSQRLLNIVWFTFWQAGLSTLLTLMAALPCAGVMAHYDFRGKKLIRTIASIPFVLPAVVVAAAFQASFGRHGVVSFILIEHPLALVLMAHVFYNFSVMLRIISSTWAGLQGRIKEAAQMLGGGPLQVFWYIVLPLLKPSILAASALVFIFCFSSFGIILILGGPTMSTIEVEIYRQAAHLFNLPLAGFLSLVQIGFTLCLMGVYTRFTKRSARFKPETGTGHLKPVEALKDKIIVGSTILFIICLSLMPLLILASQSFIVEGRISFDFYRALWINTTGSIFYVPPVQAIGYSVLFAGTALVIALLTGICAAVFIRYCDQHAGKGWSAFLDPIFMLPLSTSAVTLGFGIIITLDKPPLNLRTSILIVPIAHALVGFPFVVRAILPALRAIPAHFYDAATLLGASPLQVLRTIDLPMVSRAAVAGAIFAFTISLGEFGATLFTARPDTPTIPLAIYRFLGQPGSMNYGQAMAISTILMLVTAAGYLAIENIRQDSSQGF